MNIPSKQTIVEVASTSGDRDIPYSYVANENDHTVKKRVPDRRITNTKYRMLPLSDFELLLNNLGLAKEVFHEKKMLVVIWEVLSPKRRIFSSEFYELI